MSRTVPVQPPGWSEPRGYSNGLISEGRMLFVAGQVGWDPRAATPSFPRSLVEQFERALVNVLEVVKAAGGRPDCVTRLTVYVTDKKEYLSSLGPLGDVWRRQMGSHYPAMTLVQVSGLLEDEARVELEATALL